MFEPEVFQKQMYYNEKTTCDIVGTFRRPGNCAPLSPSRYIPGAKICATAGYQKRSARVLAAGTRFYHTQNSNHFDQKIDF